MSTWFLNAYGFVRAAAGRVDPELVSMTHKHSHSDSLIDLLELGAESGRTDCWSESSQRDVDPIAVLTVTGVERSMSSVR